MATTLTFTSLKEDLRRYLERGATEAQDPEVYVQLPRLINLAEHRIATELKIEGFIEPLTSTMEVGNPVITKPDRWRQTVSINFGTGTDFANRTPLYPRSYEYCRAYWPDQSQRDQPRFYADYGYNHWLVVPTPVLAYPFEALIYQLPELLDESVQTNWLTEEAPQLLLYGALLEATPFLKNDERIGVWQGMYDRAAGAISTEDLARIQDRASQRKEA